MKQKRKNYQPEEKLLDQLNDPVAVYGNLNIVLGEAQGLTGSISDDLDLIQQSRTGVKKSSLKYLSGYLGVTMEELSDLLHSSYRNIQRKDDSELLDTYKSEKVLELGTLVTRGVQVIGNESAFKQWLKSPLLSLGNHTPLEFLDTSFGIQLVHKVLGRIETGVYS